MLTSAPNNLEAQYNLKRSAASASAYRVESLSEVNEMHRIHTAVRFVQLFGHSIIQLTFFFYSEEAAPEFTSSEYPASKQIPSTKNTPIEAFWRWQRNGEGHSIREIIQEGAASGVFSPQEYLHK